MVVPQGAAQADGHAAAAVLGVKLGADGVALVAGRAAGGIGGVAGQTGRQAVVVHKGGEEIFCVARKVLIACGGIAHIAALGGIGSLLAAGHCCARLRGADGDQAVVGNLNGLHRVRQLVIIVGVGHICDVEAQGPVRRVAAGIVQAVQTHAQLGGDSGGDAGAVVVAAVNHHGINSFLAAHHFAGDRRLYIRAVDLDGVQNGALAPQLLTGQLALHDVLNDAGEGLVHHDVHTGGGQRIERNRIYLQLHVLHSVRTPHRHSLNSGLRIPLAAHLQSVVAAGHADDAVCTVLAGDRRLEGLCVLFRTGLVERH